MTVSRFLAEMKMSECLLTSKMADGTGIFSVWIFKGKYGIINKTLPGTGVSFVHRRSD